MKNKTEKFNCPVGITLSLIGGKYKVVILWYLFDKKILRYGELQKILKGVTAKMLIQQLRELEEDGLVKRKVYPVVPPKVEYSKRFYALATAMYTVLYQRMLKDMIKTTDGAEYCKILLKTNLK